MTIESLAADGGHSNSTLQAVIQFYCDKRSLPAEAILFSGDTQSAEINGPKAFGMHSLHIDDLRAKLGNMNIRN